MFRPVFLCEDTLGIAGDGDHEIFRWDTGQVFFSCCQKGQAISAHFSAGEKALRHIKQAINEFCDWVFESAPWCKMILACIVKPSVERIVLKCGFTYLEALGDLQIYMRAK